MNVGTRHWVLAGTTAVGLHAAVALGMAWSPPLPTAGPGARAVVLSLPGGASTPAQPAGPPAAGPAPTAVAPLPATVAPAAPLSSVPSAPTVVPPAPALAALPVHPPPVRTAEPVAVAKAVVPPAQAAAAAKAEPAPIPRPEAVRAADPPPQPVARPRPASPTVPTVGPVAEAEPMGEATGTDPPISAAQPAGQGTPHAGSGTAAPTGTSAASGTADYLSALRAWLERHKEYPIRARRRRIEGTALLVFVMDRSGTVLAHRIERSAGEPSLDRAALEMIERARPLPPLPGSIAGASLEVRVPVQFSLR